jgi:hypothetical protein
MFPNSFGRPAPLDYGREVDAGAVARFFNSVYAWMACGLAVTAAVAWWLSTQPDLLRSVHGGAFVALFIVEIVLVMVISSAVQKVGPGLATVLFLVFAAVNGVALSGIFLLYANALIASAFFVTAGMFGAMSIYGMVTRRDLTSLGAFLFMGLIGIIIASVVSIFWHPTILTVLINYIGAFIFIGLTAYDTQRLKAMAFQTQGDGRLAARLSVTGALMLYLDFLNLFLFILRIMGGNDNRR